MDGPRCSSRIGSEDFQSLVARFNGPPSPYPSEKLIHQLFEEQVRRTPLVTAFVSRNQSVTFAELNARANQLARHLRTHGIGRNRRVGVCIEPSLDMIVATLGVLKANGVSVPLNPGCSRECLRSMVEDAAPGVLLTHEHLRERLPRSGARVIALDRDWRQISAYGVQDLPHVVCARVLHDLAYVIYTPELGVRGVMVEHCHVMSMWHGFEKLYAQALPCFRVAVNASFGFDASLEQFVQLLSGRTLVLVPVEARLDAALMLAFMQEQRIDAIHCTPSQLNRWVDTGLLESWAHRPALVLIGGGAIDPQLWLRLAQSQDTIFFKVYGPIEGAPDVTAARINDDFSEPHIGRPLENRRIYILDAEGDPVPVGVRGEIHIGGAGVARGYLNGPELTDERFMRDPFSSIVGARMYRSGDLGRWRADGTIEHLGRSVEQQAGSQCVADSRDMAPMR